MSLALLLRTELEVDVERGHDVFGISAPGRYVEAVEAVGVTHVPVKALKRTWGLVQDGRAMLQLTRTIRRLRLDVLHTHNPKTGVMGRIAGRLARVPVVVNTCHGLWARPEDSWRKRAFVYGLEGLACRFSDFELFQNADDARTLRRALKPGRSLVVGNGIDLTRFHPDEQERRRVRAEWGVSDDELIVGAVGRQVTEKGLGEFGAVAASLGDRARFIWVGPDDGESGPDIGAGGAVEFVGERTDMPAVYAAFDVFVLASYREGFSRAGMEAAASGLPMVLSDIRGCREVGTNGEHLLLVPPRDPRALSDAVERLLSEPELRTRLAQAARTRAVANFDQRDVAAASLRVYDTVARTKGLAWSPVTA